MEPADPLNLLLEEKTPHISNFTGCLLGHWVFCGCLKGIWRVSERYLYVSSTTFWRKNTFGHKTIFGHNIFFGPKGFFLPKLFPPKFFLRQNLFLDPNFSTQNLLFYFIFNQKKIVPQNYLRPQNFVPKM